MEIPTTNQIIRKKTNLAILSNSSAPSNEFFTAIEESITIITTANKYSTINTPKTKFVKAFLRKFKSVKALMIIVVDDMDNIAPKKILSRYVKCNNRPAP